MYKVFIKIKRSKEKKFKTIYRCLESTEKIMSLLDSLNLKGFNIERVDIKFIGSKHEVEKQNIM